MKKRALCILLALMLTVSVLPLSASAAGGVKIDKTNFPDNTFRALIHGTYDTNGDWKLSAAELAAVNDYFMGMAPGIPALILGQQLFSFLSMENQTRRTTAASHSR